MRFRCGTYTFLMMILLCCDNSEYCWVYSITWKAWSFSWPNYRYLRRCSWWFLTVDDPEIRRKRDSLLVNLTYWATVDMYTPWHYFEWSTGAKNPFAHEVSSFRSSVSIYWTSKRFRFHRPPFVIVLNWNVPRPAVPCLYCLAQCQVFIVMIMTATWGLSDRRILRIGRHHLGTITLSFQLSNISRICNVLSRFTQCYGMSILW